jgi:hypothetical protein
MSTIKHLLNPNAKPFIPKSIALIDPTIKFPIAIQPQDSDDLIPENTLSTDFVFTIDPSAKAPNDETTPDREQVPVLQVSSGG